MGAPAYILDLSCSRCGRTFECPSLGESTYGEVLLHTSDGTASRRIELIDNPAFDFVTSVLTAAALNHGQLSWQVCAALADPVGGRRFGLTSASPHCQAGEESFRELHPGAQWATVRTGAVEDATFREFAALAEGERRERVLRAARELMAREQLAKRPPPEPSNRGDVCARPSTRRRELAFVELGEVMPEVEQLLRGHRVVGRWSLGPICRHLRLGFAFSVDGFPQRAPWVVRRTIGALARRVVLSLGWMPQGVPVPGGCEPTESATSTPLDATVEAEGLRTAIVRFAAHRGVLDEHPFLGRCTRGEWERFHRLHCAHHLSFVLPVGSEV
jgi:hypothetical protein